MNSPLGFIDELRHYVNVAKLMSGKSSFSGSEMEIYTLLEHINQVVELNIKKEEHIYPETIPFFNAVKSNLELILSRKDSRLK